MSAPFRIGVHFDADELIGFTDDDATTDELEIRPGGQLGSKPIILSRTLENI